MKASVQLYPPFSRGPVDEPVLITSENQLLETFGEPSSTDRQYEGWLTISSYLAYGGVVQVVRSDNEELSNAFVGTASSIKINSLADYESRGYDEFVIPGVTVAARNPGSWANGVLVAFIDGQADQILNVPGISTSAVVPVLGDGILQYIEKETAGAGTTSIAQGFLKGIITGINTNTDDIQVKVLSFKPSDDPNENITSDDGFVEVDYQQGGTWSYVADGFRVYDSAGITTVTEESLPRDWFDDQSVQLNRSTSVKWNQLANRPTTTAFGENRSARFDEFHVVIFDATGEVTGNAGTILEKNIGISKATDAEFSVGSPSYWRRYLANNSDYIFGGSEPVGVVTCSFEEGVGNGFVPETGGNWDQPARNVNFFGSGNLAVSLEGGKKL